MPTCGLAELACLNNICSVLITARCATSPSVLPRLQPGRVVRVEPVRVDSNRFGSARTYYLAVSEGRAIFVRFLLLSTFVKGTTGGGACIPSPIPGFPHCRARLLPLIGAARTGPRQPCGHPRLLRPSHVAARLLQHHFLRR